MNHADLQRLLEISVSVNRNSTKHCDGQIQKDAQKMDRCSQLYDQEV